jgi:hypothetical protein
MLAVVLLALGTNSPAGRPAPAQPATLRQPPEPDPSPLPEEPQHQPEDAPFDWKELVAYKASLPRYRPPAAAAGAALPFPFPIKVISLRRATARRASIVEQLGFQQVPFEFVDALDGDDPASFPTAEVGRYFSGERLAEVRFKKGNRRYNAACDLSHLRMMHALLGTSLPAQLVLEDDFVMPLPESMAAHAPAPGGGSHFLAALNATLHALPEDWDVAFLALCLEELGGAAVEAGPGVRVVKSGACAIALAYTRRAALIVLREAEAGKSNFDNLLVHLAVVSGRAVLRSCRALPARPHGCCTPLPALFILALSGGRVLLQAGKLNAYVADPPLVRWGKFPSQINV